MLDWIVLTCKAPVFSARYHALLPPTSPLRITHNIEHFLEMTVISFLNLRWRVILLYAESVFDCDCFYRSIGRLDVVGSVLHLLETREQSHILIL